jgi:ketosteroid isomerase-like protein
MRARLPLYLAVALFITIQRLPAPISDEQTPSPTTRAKSTRTETMLQGAKPNDIIATITQLKTKWESCVPTHDVSVIRSLVADDFSGVNANGKIMNKSGLLEQVGKDSDVYYSATNQALDVQVRSDTIAIAIGTAHETGRSQDGKTFDRTFRLIHGCFVAAAGSLLRAR